jgi:release factor glutamine methyltransferase
MDDSPHSDSAPRRPAAPTRRETVIGIRSELESHGIESPELEAERLVASALGVTRHTLATTGSIPLALDQATAVALAVGRRLDREPLQHLEGEAAFRNLILVSDGRALIPRPETEQLVDWIAEWAGTRPPLGRALDIGTGSGAIALALLTEGIVNGAVGMDVSGAALDQAEENRRRSGVPRDRLELRRAGPDIWSGVSGRFDLIASNPPYVADPELAGLPDEIRDHEPKVALAGGPDGLDVLRLIIAGAAGHLNPDGALFLEIGAAQAESVCSLLERDGGWADVRVRADLAGKPRFVRALPAQREAR